MILNIRALLNYLKSFRIMPFWQGVVVHVFKSNTLDAEQKDLC